MEEKNESNWNWVHYSLMWRRVQSRLNCMQRRKAVAFAVPYYCGMKTDLWCVGEPRVHSRSQLLPALLQSPALGCLPSALLLCPLRVILSNYWQPLLKHWVCMQLCCVYCCQYCTNPKCPTVSSFSSHRTVIPISCDHFFQKCLPQESFLISYMTVFSFPDCTVEDCRTAELSRCLSGTASNCMSMVPVNELLPLNSEPQPFLLYFVILDLRLQTALSFSC